ncbi:MAG TPA: hypothetical protein VJB64_03105 [Patescibacteria group bacterium]|nr:hypothetical protein [Patescibacteria group bacterium]
MKKEGEMNVESRERERMVELETRYETLVAWAKEQGGFVTVYRVEGDPSWNVDRSMSQQLVGTWYTDRWSQVVARYKPEIERNSGMSARIFALVIPKSLLDTREEMDRGMDQVNVINEELRAGRQEIADPSEATAPSLEAYLDQFAFVREYRALKSKFGR